MADAVPLTEVVIDLNVRVRGQLTYAGFEDVRGEMPRVGMSVLAVEEETSVAAPAIVTDLDADKRLIYLAVAWREFQDHPVATNSSDASS